MNVNCVVIQVYQLADESQSENEDGQSKGGDKKQKSKKQMLKSSFASAFQSIISKKLDESTVQAVKDGPILAKYKKPAKEVSEEKQRENEMKQKRQEKERIRIMGRTIPTAEDEERERELQIIATKGGKQRAIKIIQSVGNDKINAGHSSSNQRIISQLQSKQSRWKVLEDDSEDEDGNVKVVDDFDSNNEEEEEQD
ncbi:UNKNOWN [Stylonychia lemnae]|uniref:Uncharacterized protein n=1 Tax=Stylonychia lemnae TaxID=5949 RepID=A0A078AM17_STYLE|nr:UNKNOWN [Stylonychia lemnae]|eukprot:CDW82911.1 UNKNOWN [Stylonychia lemnae]